MKYLKKFNEMAYNPSSTAYDTNVYGMMNPDQVDDYESDIFKQNVKEIINQAVGADGPEREKIFLSQIGVGISVGDVFIDEEKNNCVVTGITKSEFKYIPVEDMSKYIKISKLHPDELDYRHTHEMSKMVKEIDVETAKNNFLKKIFIPNKFEEKPKK